MQKKNQYLRSKPRVRFDIYFVNVCVKPKFYYLEAVLPRVGTAFLNSEEGFLENRRVIRKRVPKTFFFLLVSFSHRQRNIIPLSMILSSKIQMCINKLKYSDFQSNKLYQFQKYLFLVLSFERKHLKNKYFNYFLKIVYSLKNAK